MSNYLLEIGVEEFPAKHIKSTQKQLINGIEDLLMDNDYLFEKIFVNSTPRRFAISVNGIVPDVENSSEIIKGPARKIAFDEEGNPSRALQGFMNSKGISLDDIIYEEVNGEDYIYAKIKKETIELDKLLSKNIPKIIKNVSNPRQMRWGGKNIKFLRPIRWIVSILDDKVLDFDLEKIPVSNVTRGHRTLGSNHIVIEKIQDYEKLLKNNYVIVSEEERRKIIVRGINRLSKERGGNYIADEDLLNEVVQINEYPTPFLGEFDSQYLDLPKEVVITPMKDHQRYFPVVNDDGNLLPYFITVRNGDNKGIENVIQGNKKVLLARLEDAKFFYNRDIKNTLEEYVAKLDKVTFQEGLGNMLDKTNRLVKLCEIIGTKISCGNEAIELAKKAAYLSKADLVTSTVIEFTELQGVMGRIFAEESGENPLVAQAIEEQYMPVKAGAELPVTTSGIVLSLADKIDNITGLHSIGIEVTGSQDMYGQRRAALGILNILIENQIDLDLEPVIKESLYNYVDSFGETFSYNEVVEKVLEFIKVRFKNLMLEKGLRYDIVDSVIEEDEMDIYNMYSKAEALSTRFNEDDNFNDQITKYLRIVNISSKVDNYEIEEDRLEENDIEIYKLSEELENVDILFNEQKFKSGLEFLDVIVNKMDKYLDSTLINVEDEVVRKNRQSLVKMVSDRILRIFNPKEIVR